MKMRLLNETIHIFLIFYLILLVGRRDTSPPWRKYKRKSHEDVPKGSHWPPASTITTYPRRKINLIAK